QMPLAQLGWIDLQLLSDPVHLDFLSEARLGSPISPLRTTRSLVREHPYRFDFEARDLVGSGLKCSGVKGAGDAQAAVRSAVQNRAVVHRGDGAVLLEPGLGRHQSGMPSAVAVEHLLARQTDLDRT